MSRGGDQAGRLRGELARLGPLNPFEILGVAPSASSEAVRAAFLAATKKFHPSLFGRENADVQDLATEVFLVVKRAYSQLSDDAKRKAQRDKLLGPADRMGPLSAAAMAPAAPRSTPESPAVPAARATPPAGPPVAAAGSPRPPMSPAPLRPQRPARPIQPPPGTPREPPARTTDVQAILDAAKLRASRFEDANRHMNLGRFAEAREILQKIAAEDPQNRRYRTRLHLAWGLEYRDLRRFDEAVREMERAVALDPDNTEVADVLRKTREQASQRGLISKLFGR